MRAVALPFALVLSLASLPVGASEPTEPPPAATKTTEPPPLAAPDGFDQSFSNDAKTRDAAWVVRQSEKYHPSAAPAIQTVNVYAVLEPREGGYFGNFTTATIAAVPLPIPITLSGTFQMYRLDA